MTIAITAPQKFDLQDFVCLEMMLRFHTSDSAVFLVEPPGGEDGELALDGKRIEIQVKGAAGAVTLKTIASCLAHAPPRQTKPTLFERLLSDPHRIVVLVTSGRCDDEASIYTMPATWKGEEQNDASIKIKHANALLEAFANAEPSGKEGGELKARRKRHCASISKSVDPKDVRSALRRLIVLEQVTERKLREQCLAYLQLDHRIPRDTAGDVFNRLHDGIKSAKANNEDAFSYVRKEIADTAPISLQPVSYISRGNEAELERQVVKNNVLLLTGSPRVGKSDAARWIASQFEPRGYDVREFKDAESAERFLLEPGKQRFRLALLDDPLGGAHPVANPERQLARITSLIPRLAPNRRLIVAQGQERLVAASNVRALSNLKTSGRSWLELDAGPPTFLTTTWSALVDQYSVPQEIARKVGAALLNGGLQLEAGCLLHLATHHTLLQGKLSLDSVLRIARQDAASLGNALSSEGFYDVLLALAVGTTPALPIQPVELAFLTGLGGHKLPGKVAGLGTMYVFGGDVPKKEPAPTYEVPPIVAPETEQKIDTLEHRRILQIGSNDKINFTHAFYRAAADSVLSKPTQLSEKRLIQAVERGLFCISPCTSRAVARNLDWIYDLSGISRQVRNLIIDQAIAGLESNFPSTRDACFLFLVRKFSDLPSDKVDLSAWVRRVTSITFESVEWIGGEAWLSVQRVLGLDDIARQLTAPTRRSVTHELAALNSPDGSHLSAEHAARVLAFYAGQPKLMTPTAVGRLLSYDEAIIRANAAKLWLAMPRTEDSGILKRIFSEDHPSVGVAALKGAIKGWHAWPSARRKRILDLMKNMAAAAPMAVAMLEYLVLFGREEHTGRMTPWKIFEELMPVVLASLPDKADMNDARFFSAVRESTGVLAPEAVVAICEGWMAWLERETKSGVLPSDYELGVFDILVIATKKHPRMRAGILQRLLNLPGTGPALVFVADATDNWNDLTKAEQDCVEKLILDDRPDVAWLRASVLTRDTVPPTLERKLLGSDLSLSAPPDDLVACVPQDVLHSAIHVFTGIPQPLYWLGKHGRGAKTWEAVVRKIATMPTHPLFEVAWRHIASSGDGPRLVPVIKSLGIRHVERMLSILVRIKLGCTGWFMPEAWTELLNQAPDAETRQRWIESLLPNIPGILESLSDIEEWLESEEDQEVVVRGLTGDLASIGYLIQAEK